MTDIASTLLDFARKAGSDLGPLEFYHHVQTAFHDIESEYYDDLHSEMYVYLGDIFNRLFSIAVKGKRQVRVLDIGAGTGLVETFLAKEHSAIIERIDVVEPNARMIRKLEEKNKVWKLPVVCKNSYLENAGLTEDYDVAVCSSVLHHIPDLPGFFAVLRGLVKPGGFILTMQDPRNEILHDDVGAERRSAFKRYQTARQRPQRGMAAFKSLVRSALNAIGADGMLVRRNPIEKEVNRLLKDRNVIRCSLTLEEIWAITDIHVPNQPGAIGSGISLNQLRTWMPDFETRTYVTYNFFNANLLELSEEYVQREKKYLMEEDGHGFLFASLFKRSS